MARIAIRVKFQAVRDVLHANKGLVETAGQYGVSRQSLYLWVKRVRESGSFSALNNRYRRGRKHQRRISWRVEHEVLEAAIARPQWGVGRIASELRKRGLVISSFGVWKTLARRNLHVRQLREQFSQEKVTGTVFAHKITASARVGIIESYLQTSDTISETCRKLEISRKTFYLWLSRYKNGPEDKLNALCRRFRKGYDHPRCKTGPLREKILEIIAQNPALSVHKLHAYINETAGRRVVITNQALQGLMLREGLSTYERRLAFARSIMPEPRV